MRLEALYEKAEEPKRTPVVEVDDDEADVDPENAIRCAACDHAITSESERVEVHGAHEHRRVNTSGADFHVGCFGRAPGCIASGQPTSHWTWFPGCAWQIACCRGCGAHLGWAFSGQDRFHALILPKLRRDDGGGS